jgi:NitT/TauT family transport system ATP-binding protein
MVEHAIRCEQVSKTYESESGRVLALDDVSLYVERGKLVSLLGPSGCGKSTLLSILAGLTRPTAGKVFVEGAEPRPRPDVGMMFQDSLLFPWRSVLKNVLLPAELFGLAMDKATDRARDLLTLVGLQGWESRYSWELSGGMRQRVALARVLLPDPDILLLDEPFGSLDEMTRESLDLEMMRIASDAHKTVVLVTHNVYEAVLISDQVVVLSPRPGRLAGIVDIPVPQPRNIEITETSLFTEKVAEARRLLSKEVEDGQGPLRPDRDPRH